MSSVTTALAAGLVFGLATIASMLPMALPDKRAALASAFLDRFAIGFLIPLVDLPLPGWAVGLVVGLLLSLPPAIMTRRYYPILGLGAVGGALIGLLTRITIDL